MSVGLRGHGQRRPAAVGRHGGRQRRGSADSRPGVASRTSTRTPTRPRHASPHAASPIDHPLELAPGGELGQRSVEVGQEEHRVRPRRDMRRPLPWSTVAGRCSEPPVRQTSIVGPPPLDGVDEAPPRSKARAAAGGPSRFSRRVPEASTRPRWTLPIPAACSQLADAAVARRRAPRHPRRGARRSPDGARSDWRAGAACVGQDRREERVACGAAWSAGAADRRCRAQSASP